MAFGFVEEPRGPLPTQRGGAASGGVSDGKNLGCTSLFASETVAVFVMESSDVRVKRVFGAAMDERHDLFSLSMLAA
jgi:hypothetical protein